MLFIKIKNFDTKKKMYKSELIQLFKNCRHIIFYASTYEDLLYAKKLVEYIETILHMYHIKDNFLQFSLNEMKLEMFEKQNKLKKSKL